MRSSDERKNLLLHETDYSVMHLHERPHTAEALPSPESQPKKTNPFFVQNSCQLYRKLLHNRIRPKQPLTRVEFSSLIYGWVRKLTDELNPSDSIK
jgi:hypothetical protein